MKLQILLVTTFIYLTMFFLLQNASAADPNIIADGDSRSFSDVNLEITDGGYSSGLYAVNDGEITVTGQTDGTNTLTVAEYEKYGIHASTNSVITISNMSIASTRESLYLDPVGLSAEFGGTVNLNGTAAGASNSFTVNNNQMGIIADNGGAVNINNMDLHFILGGTDNSEAFNALNSSVINITGRTDGSQSITMEYLGRGIRAENEGSEVNIKNMDFLLHNGNGPNGIWGRIKAKISLESSAAKTNEIAIFGYERGISAESEANIDIKNMTVSVTGANGQSGTGISAASIGRVTITGKNDGSNTLYLENLFRGIEVDNSSMEIDNMNITADNLYFNGANNIIYTNSGSLSIKSAITSGYGIMSLNGNDSGSSVVSINNNSYITIQSYDINVTKANFAEFGDATNNRLYITNGSVTLESGYTGFTSAAGGKVNASIAGVTFRSDHLIDSVNADFISSGNTLYGTIKTENGKVTLDQNTVWNMLDDSYIDKFVVNNSTVDVRSQASGLARAPGDFNTLTINGTQSDFNNSVIIMNSDIGDDSSESDKIVITHSDGSVLGTSEIVVFDTRNRTAAQTVEGIKLIDSQAVTEDGNFVLRGNQIDSGAYVYKLYRGSTDGETDPHSWYLRTLAEPTDASLTFSNIPTIMVLMAKTGMNSLNKRLGDLRRTPEEKLNGIWARTYGKKFSIDPNIEMDLEIYGVEAGYDRRIFPDSEDRFYIGIMGGYLATVDLKSEQNNGRNGNGYGKVPTAGLYATWLNKNGFFADVTFRNFFAELDMTVYDALNSAINYSPGRNIIAASAEFGKEFQIETSNKSKFLLEPKTEWVVIHMGSDDQNTSGYALQYEDTTAFSGRVALFAGYNKTFSGGTILEPYLEGGYAYEFDGKEDIRYAGATFKSDYSGGNFDIGGGLNVHFTNAISLYSNLEYEKGPKLENYGFNAGIRFGFGGAKKEQEPVKMYVKVPVQPVMPVVSIIELSPVHLRLINFDFDKFALDRKSEDYLTRRVRELNERSFEKIEVIGHTDNVGSHAYNQKLSERRARSVADYLIELGLPADKVFTKGMSYDEPIATNSTKEGRAENRRAEIKITY